MTFSGDCSVFGPRYQGMARFLFVAGSFRTDSFVDWGGDKPSIQPGNRQTPGVVSSRFRGNEYRVDHSCRQIDKPATRFWPVNIPRSRLIKKPGIAISIRKTARFELLARYRRVKNSISYLLARCLRLVACIGRTFIWPAPP